MRDDDPGGPHEPHEDAIPDEPAAAAEDREAAQQRGRERVLSMWRAAVACVIDAAHRAEAEAAAAAPAAASDGGDDDGREVSTWSFPPKIRAVS